jgi:hypothetical protein
MSASLFQLRRETRHHDRETRPETSMFLPPRPNMAPYMLQEQWTALVLLRPRSDLPTSASLLVFLPVLMLNRTPLIARLPACSLARHCMA